MAAKKQQQAPILELCNRYIEFPDVRSANVWDMPKLVYRHYFMAGGNERARNGSMLEISLQQALIAGSIPPEDILLHQQLWKGKKGSEADVIIKGDKRLGRPPCIFGCKTSGRERIGLDFYLALYVFAMDRWSDLSLFDGVKPLMYILTRQEKNKAPEDWEQARIWCDKTNDAVNLGTPAKLLSILDSERMHRMFKSIGAGNGRRRVG
jgi:hypothetical protein